MDRILHPGPQSIKADPDALNKHFSSTLHRLLGSEANPLYFLLDLINSLPGEHPTILARLTYAPLLTVK